MESTVIIILATGINTPRIGGRRLCTRGFTLIELLLVIALISLAGTVFVLNFNRLLSGSENEALEDSLRRAVFTARFEAAARRIETALHWDPEAGLLVISEHTSGAQLQSILLASDFGQGGSGQILFYATQTRAGIAAPFGSPQGDTLTHLRFAPDRSGTPFKAVITRPGTSPIEMVFDPFSGFLLGKEETRL